MNLNNIKLGVSTITEEGEIYLYRHGKNPDVALDKRLAERDLFAALVVFMMHNAPRGSVKQVSFDEKAYEITVKPIPKLKHKEADHDDK